MFHRFFHIRSYISDAPLSTIIACALLFLFTLVFSQATLAQHIYIETSDSSVVIQADSLYHWRDQLSSFDSYFHKRGYLSAVSKVIEVRSDTVFARFESGPLYSFTYEGVGRKPQLFTADSLSIRKTAELQIRELENRGYPFAVVHYSPKIENDSILSFQTVIEAGPYIAFDSLIIRSEKPYSQAFFRQYLRAMQGEPYDEASMQKVPERLRQLPFARAVQPASVLFREGEADLYLYLEDKPANQFDGVIGFQPDAQTGRIVLTGDVNLSLHNALRRGERIDVRWRRLQQSTQRLFASGNLLYLLQTRWGVWGEIDIYRRDSTFSTTQLEASAGYLFGAERYLRGFAERWTSNPLREGVNDVDDVSITRYGLKYRQFQLDNLLNPMRGYYVASEASAGFKTLTTGDEDPVTTETEQFELTTEVGIHVPFFRRFSLALRASAATRIDSTLRLNEHYRIGGLSNLRGFDEEGIFASSYAIGTVEFKYSLDASSAVFLFADQGWYERTGETFITDTPLGFGAGALIGTSGGSFRIAYALGSQQGNPVLLRDARIHFGYVNRF